MVRIITQRDSNTQEMRGVEVRLFGVFPGVKASVKTCQCEMLRSRRGELIPRRPAAKAVFMWQSFGTTEVVPYKDMAAFDQALTTVPLKPVSFHLVPLEPIDPRNSFRFCSGEGSR
jgi:hypothetical protein